MIPLSYTLRNVFRRPLQTLQLIGGSTLVILLLMLALAINQSMQETSRIPVMKQTLFF